MIIYCYFPKLNTWGRIDDTGTYTEHDPEDIPNLLGDDLMLAHSEYIYIHEAYRYTDAIIRTLWNIGAEFTDERRTPKKMKNKECNYLISGNGTIYSFTFKVRNNHIKRIYDSANIFKMGLHEIATDLGDEDTKRGTLVGLYRGIWKLNNISKSKKILPPTISGYARRIYQRTSGAKLLANVSGKKIDKDKKVDAEKYFRQTYHGGYNEIIHHGEEIAVYNNGIVLDVNSLYPYEMSTKPLPTGQVHYIAGAPTQKEWNDVKQSYIYMTLCIRVALRLKDGGIPCVQIDNDEKNKWLYEQGNITDTCYTVRATGEKKGEPQKVKMTLTQTDFMLMYENYEILEIEYIAHTWQPTTRHYFSEYIPKLYTAKQNAKTICERTIYKLLLNCLSGLMARLPEYENDVFTVSENGQIFHRTTKNGGSKSYVNVGAAITSYARADIIRLGKKCGSRWLYSDTDSLHLAGCEIPEFIQIGDKMGEFKIEKKFYKASYFAKKNYIMETATGLEITASGLRKDDRIFVERMGSDLHRTNSNISDLQPLMDSIIGENKKRLCISYSGFYKVTEQEADAIEHKLTGDRDSDDVMITKHLDKLIQEWTTKNNEFISALMSQDIRDINKIMLPVTVLTSFNPFELTMCEHWQYMTATGLA